MNLQFGTGVLYGIPNAGNLASNPTPQKFGVLQECQVTFKGDLKKLYGQKQFAVATGRAKLDVSGKGKIALLDPNALNQLYFAQTATTGINRLVADESHIPSANLPVADESTFVRDYGVVNGATGTNMTFVEAAPAVGQYSVAAGGYIFNAAETAPTVLISYMESDPSTTSTTITLKNQFQGYAPEFRALMANTFRNKYFALELNCCTMGQVSIPSRMGDFWIADFDFEANADATDTLGAIYADTL